MRISPSTVYENKIKIFRFFGFDDLFDYRRYDFLAKFTFCFAFVGQQTTADFNNIKRLHWRKIIARGTYTTSNSSKSSRFFFHSTSTFSTFAKGGPFLHHLINASTLLLEPWAIISTDPSR